jgi:hypothetical protein
VERKTKELRQLAVSNSSGGGHVASDLFQRVGTLERSLRERDDELARLRGHVKVGWRSLTPPSIRASAGPLGDLVSPASTKVNV